MATDARSTGTATWSYDNADQLKALTDTSTNGNSTWGYDVAHELTSLVKKTGTTTNQNLTLGYDVARDRTQQTDSVSGTTAAFGYNQADRLISYTKGTTSASYVYNGNGLRVSRAIGSTTTGQVWDVAERLPLLLQDGSTSYVTGPGGLPLEQVNGNKPSYYYQDQLGSTRAILDSRGSTLATYTYDPSGTLKSSTGTVSNPFQYAGQYTDSESGLQYLRARYYDPGTQQFLTVDPMASQTGEPYTYTADNALNFGDPSGLCTAAGINLPFGSSNDCSDDIGATAYNAVSGILNSAAEPVYSGASAAETNCLAQQAAAAGTGSKADTYTGIATAISLSLLPGGAEVDVGGAGVTIMYARVWPASAVEMDNLLGFKGTRIPDTPNTAGRNKVVWRDSDGVKAARRHERMQECEQSRKWNSSSQRRVMHCLSALSSQTPTPWEWLSLSSGMGTWRFSFNLTR